MFNIACLSSFMIIKSEIFSLEQWAPQYVVIFHAVPFFPPALDKCGHPQCRFRVKSLYLAGRVCVNPLICKCVCVRIFARHGYANRLTTTWPGLSHSLPQSAHVQFHTLHPSLSPSLYLSHTTRERERERSGGKKFNFRSLACHLYYLGFTKPSILPTNSIKYNLVLRSRIQRPKRGLHWSKNTIHNFLLLNTNPIIHWNGSFYH